MTSFISGATGFIGSLLMRRLLQEGHRVVALVRSESMHKTTEEHENLWWVEGDLLDADSVKQAMEGCDRVFHAAAYASVWAPDDQLFYDVNLTGTKNVLKAAVEHDVGRLVFTSTAATLAPADPDQPSDETCRNQDLTNPYAHSKFLAEDKVRACNESDGLQTVIVHPTRVFGPGPLTESNAVTRIFKFYLEGKWRFQIGDGSYFGNYCYVRDLVEGHLLAMEHGRPGEHYILGGSNLSFHELFELMAEAADLQRTKIPLPEPVMRGFARFEQFRADTFNARPLITPKWIDKYLKNWALSNDKAKRDLGYKITPASEAIKKTMKWLQAPSSRLHGYTSWHS